jgi:hypothetical protein
VFNSPNAGVEMIALLHERREEARALTDENLFATVALLRAAPWRMRLLRNVLQ